MKLIHWLKENYWLTLILIVAAFLRFYHADFQSLWGDEILSMNNSDPKLTLKQLNESVLFWEYLPQLYFYLLRFVFEAFGFTTEVARLFSAVIGVFGVYAIYLLGKAIYSRNAGLIAALFLSVNYFHISYSQEIRPYGMLFLFSVLSFYRLVLFIKNNTLRNAIYYGIFTGLIIHSQFFGFITIFSQCLILLFFLVKTPAENRKNYFLYCLAAGATFLMVIAPAYKAIQRMFTVNSFWLSQPAPDVYTDMFRDFLGKSEMVIFGANLILLFFVLSLFRTKSKPATLENIKNDKLVFSAVILIIWMITTLLLPLLKSYLDIPMIIYRYLISAVAILVLFLAIGTELISNKLVKTIVISYVAVISVVDLFVVKKYYTTVTKSQFREMTAKIREHNPEKSKVVAYWSWLFPYFFPEGDIKIEGKSLQDYADGMRSGAVGQEAFWYADANSRPFTLTPEAQAYLDQNFILQNKIECFDAWANYYVPKNVKPIGVAEFNSGMFKSANFDAKNNMLFFENVDISSAECLLEKGTYKMVIQGNSLPEKPIKGENAHLIVKVNGKEVGAFYLSEKLQRQYNTITFTQEKEETVKIQLVYDNDLALDGADRNVIIYSIRLEKQ